MRLRQGKLVALARASTPKCMTTMRGCPILIEINTVLPVRSRYLQKPYRAMENNGVEGTTK
jgi:hypothetical protein